MFGHVTSWKSWLAVVAVASLGLFGCDSGGSDTGGAKKKKSGGGIASQVAAGASDEDEKEESGAAAIDHEGVTEIPDDPELAKKGEKLFSKKGCDACHAPDKKQVGPPLAGVTDRREATWIAKMIQHPDEMLNKDPQAKKLLQEYGTRMANQNVTPDETRALMAYLATLEK